MNRLYKILVVSIVVFSFGFARTSGKFEVSDGFLERVQQAKEKPSFVLLEKKAEENEGSLKWRRRHKRRKKAPNRRPQRGK